MSAPTSVLFDAPGPRARTRATTISIVSAVLMVAVVAAVVYGLRAQLTADKLVPFIQPDTWLYYLVPGLLNTLQAAVISIVLAGLIGVVLGTGRLSHLAVIRVPAAILTEFFRAVPVLMAMIFAYYLYITTALFSGFTLALAAAVTGLMFYNGAVIAELIRSGVHSLPKGQSEAGLAVGLTRQQTLFSVQLPQAITAMLPSLVSQLVVILKDTALASAVAYPELLKNIQTLSSGKGNIIAALIVGALIFIVVNYGLTSLAGWLEKKVGKRTSGRTSLKVAEAAAGIGGPTDPLNPGNR